MGDYIYCDGRWIPWPEAPEGPETYEGIIANAFGYEPLEDLELGASDAGFWVVVNIRMEEHRDLPHEYMLELVTGEMLQYVYVPDLGNLLRVLGELAPIAQAALASHDYRKREDEANEPWRTLAASEQVVAVTKPERKSQE